MRGFAWILGLLVLEAAFLWHVAAPHGVARARVVAPVAVEGTPALRGAAGMARAAGSSPDGVRYPIRTFAREGRGEASPGFSL